MYFLIIIELFYKVDKEVISVFLSVSLWDTRSVSMKITARDFS